MNQFRCRFKYRFALVFFMLSVFIQLKSQEQRIEITDINWAKYSTPVFALSTNLLYDATTSMNLGMEFKTGKRFTLKLPVVYNPWLFEDNKKFKFILAQPELRWWACEPFSGHYLGLNANYAFFNVGGVGTDHTKQYRYQGNLYGGGISYGYQFYLGTRWNLEASIGAGYAFLDYDVYYCESCGEFIRTEQKHYFGLTQVGITLIYIIK